MKNLPLTQTNAQVIAGRIRALMFRKNVETPSFESFIKIERKAMRKEKSKDVKVGAVRRLVIQ